jgi:hypothetical protein
VPWSELDYNEDRDGYVVNFTKEQLKSAPTGSIEELVRNEGQGRLVAWFEEVPRGFTRRSALARLALTRV